MLVLSRKQNEKIVVPMVNLVITVVEVTRSGAVRLGFEAPKDVIIKRQELLTKEEQDAVASHLSISRRDS